MNHSGGQIYIAPYILLISIFPLAELCLLCFLSVMDHPETLTPLSHAATQGFCIGVLSQSIHHFVD